MEFRKLRLTGFKSFVEPTEFIIQSGLTGVVGPNGCGKSNLVEALRWVMGENSYKNMRAAAMDEVIFSGSANRPSRNTAEVVLYLDNSDRSAPAVFNNDDDIQVSRRIDRDAGSVYRINGREVRAKDVQLLFADASTGARSPSMIGQGRVGELIAAKPRARRALLEEAAGISGLHSRRHEAELRLRAAELNLDRLDDVLGQLDNQLESLKRQARQADRYKSISADIRRTEAVLFHQRWTSEKTGLAETQSSLNQLTASVAEQAAGQGQLATKQADLAAKLPPARDAEATAAAALQRLTIARDQIDQEARRLEARKRELETRQNQLTEDIGREQRLLDDNKMVLERLENEERELKHEANAGSDVFEAIAARLQKATQQVTECERAFSELTAAQAEATARKNQLERAIDDGRARCSDLAERHKATVTAIEAQRAELAALSQSGINVETMEKAELAVDKLEQSIGDAEAGTLAARIGEEAARQPAVEAVSKRNAIDAEARTLAGFLNDETKGLFPPVVDRIEVEAGYEAALGAALGEDLDVPTDQAAPVHWSHFEAELRDRELPFGCSSLSDRVKAPTELKRRLAQIGIVDREYGSELQPQLSPGQRLVSIEGDLWRWDGFVASADAPTAAAIKLAQKNRLIELADEARAASAELTLAQQCQEAAAQTVMAAEQSQRELRVTLGQRRAELDALRREHARQDSEAVRQAERLKALGEALARTEIERTDAATALAGAERDLSDLPASNGVTAALERANGDLATARAVLAEARADHDGHARMAQTREKRLGEIETERENWHQRLSGAKEHLTVLAGRKEQAAAELAELASAPTEIIARKEQLGEELSVAEAARRQAADALVELETALAAADRQTRQASDALAKAREERARVEERLEAAIIRLSEIEARIREELHCEPHTVFALCDRKEGDNLPDAGQAERKLEKLRAERERLGAVNLRAEAERSEIATQRDALAREREDLIEAISRLRQGIQSLNREGRKRLIAAFDVVNDHFGKLFAHLFGGGSAELQLIESDDPLEAGLEILAQPPGKKTQTMTLLSGGEQALTALALIFAVFLTNPAPICVLDEVDAPLDDNNVERFCDLMDQMAETTNTRFVIITHNPITMSRVNRLFGITMAERGVSQSVSVDLQTAERLREAS